MENNKKFCGEKNKFYTKTWFMLLMLVLFAPIGIFLMWRFHDEMKKDAKIILTIIFAIFFFISGDGKEATTNSKNNTGENNKYEVSKVKVEEVSKVKVEVIDFSEMQEHEILNWCNEKKLSCNFKKEYSDTVSKDGYIKQSVEATKQVEEGSKITITYSLGKAPTKAQENAVKMAKTYISIMTFSRSGLIEQLEYEGFTNEDAVYGVDNITVDWNEQAVKMAKTYLNIMTFSRSGLIEQLEYEGFTHEQAVYGVEQNGI